MAWPGSPMDLHLPPRPVHLSHGALGASRFAGEAVLGFSRAIPPHQSQSITSSSLSWSLVQIKPFTAAQRLCWSCALTSMIPVFHGGSHGAVTWLLHHPPRGEFIEHRQNGKGRSMRRKNFHPLKPVCMRAYPCYSDKPEQSASFLKGFYLSLSFFCLDWIHFKTKHRYFFPSLIRI